MIRKFYPSSVVLEAQCRVQRGLQVLHLRWNIARHWVPCRQVVTYHLGGIKFRAAGRPSNTGGETGVGRFAGMFRVATSLQGMFFQDATKL